MKLSTSARDALLALSNRPEAVIATLRNGDRAEWRADVARRQGERWFVVPIRVFRKMLRLGFVELKNSNTVSGDLIHSEYELTDAGRAALEEAD